MRWIDNDTLELEVNKCKCGNTIFKRYDGLFGYESFICSKCGTDINDLKVE